MNKGIGTIIAIVAFSAGTFFGSMATSIPVADAVSSDSTQSLNRLENVLKILTHANSRLTSINAEFENPPDPEEPPIQAALNSIITEANSAITTANDIKAKLVPP